VHLFDLSSLFTQPAPRRPLFPYTTLFRSVLGPRPRLGVGCAEDQYRSSRSQFSSASRYIQRPARLTNAEFSSSTCSPRWSLNRRSEEHTSELQSRFDLVCRLLLEKKKQN